MIAKITQLRFFDENGSILKFDQNSKLIWKKIIIKKKKKQNPIIYFANDKNILIAADNLANIYAINYLNGDLLWKKFKCICHLILK